MSTPTFTTAEASQIQPQVKSDSIAQPAASNPPKKRTIVYVDGFNLYYGAIQGTAYKWLNLERYFTNLRSNDDLVCIRYFSTLVWSGRSRQNQEIYLSALDTLPRVKVVLGHFKEKTTDCRVRACTFVGGKQFTVLQEKRTDVNIALHMLDDAYQNLCDNVVLVSGDSDLVPAVQFIKTRFEDKRVYVYIPSQNPDMGTSMELRGVAHVSKNLPPELLKHCLFPSRVPNASGGFISKPVGW